MALGLVAFGFVTGFSIGAPFFLVGLALLVLGPLRRRPRIFWPPLIGLLAFILGVLMFIPLSCTAIDGVGQVSSTVCSGILGPPWSGSGLYNPPPEAFALAFRSGAVAGVAAAIVTLAWLTYRRR
ncbi:MAG: hypothetical protein HYX54_02760 [Chloroflexi bacterium]|nr:hypothetical protein [Chloroflexota bacterium]